MTWKAGRRPGRGRAAKFSAPFKRLAPCDCIHQGAQRSRVGDQEVGGRKGVGHRILVKNSTRRLVMRSPRPRPLPTRLVQPIGRSEGRTVSSRRTSGLCRPVRVVETLVPLSRLRPPEFGLPHPPPIASRGAPPQLHVAVEQIRLRPHHGFSGFMAASLPITSAKAGATCEGIDIRRSAAPSWPWRITVPARALCVVKAMLCAPGSGTGSPSPARCSALSQRQGIGKGGR